MFDFLVSGHAGAPWTDLTITGNRYLFEGTGPPRTLHLDIDYPDCVCRAQVVKEGNSWRLKADITNVPGGGTKSALIGPYTCTGPIRFDHTFVFALGGGSDPDHFVRVVGGEP